MTQLKILNAKQIKIIRQKILEQWGADFKTDFAFLISSKNKIYIVSRDISKICYEKLNVDVVGLYFGEIMKNGELRLSIEGSQLIGSKATKNVVEISDEDVRKWLFGENIKTESKCSGFIILKNKNDFLGTGKIKENEIINFVPKIRRISSEN